MSPGSAASETLAAGSGDPVLLALKSLGSQSASALARRLKVTPQAVRKRLDRLLEDGLVSFADEASGPGRPKRRWSLSEKGHGRFPDTHAQLTTELIAAVRAEFGAAGLDRLISRREREMLRAYERQLASCRTLGAKVKALAKLRTGEGYMASCRVDGAGYVLLENHCPICAAARACQGFCRSEWAIFRRVLGPQCDVERVEHLIAGARRCAYRISPK